MLLPPNVRSLPKFKRENVWPLLTPGTPDFKSQNSSLARCFCKCGQGRFRRSLTVSARVGVFEVMFRFDVVV